MVKNIDAAFGLLNPAFASRSFRSLRSMSVWGAIACDSVGAAFSSAAAMPPFSLSSFLSSRKVGSRSSSSRSMARDLPEFTAFINPKTTQVMSPKIAHGRICITSMRCSLSVQKEFIQSMIDHGD